MAIGPFGSLEPTPRAVRLARLPPPLINLDRQIDLVVANSGSNSVSVFLGDGDGGFSDGTQFPTGPDPVAVTTGDFNSDTLKDIAVANPDNGTVSLLLEPW